MDDYEKICATRAYFIRICLLGDGAVGKTALRERYLGKGFSSNYIMTIGADFAVKQVNIASRPAKFQIWDLAGQPRFSSVRALYYRGSMGALLIFDVTRPDSFANAQSWVNELWKSNGKGPVPIVLLGNKADLRGQGADEISNEQAIAYAAKVSEETQATGFEISYMETSAKSGKNVYQAFELLGKNILDYVQNA
ncbi:MAG: GTP-binding protein [Candidatus Bathyarchaeota archaeon]|nr:MAG: GTP-binding protein [Candidatus Bathyarchaeota archaeon]